MIYPADFCSEIGVALTRNHWLSAGAMVAKVGVTVNTESVETTLETTTFVMVRLYSEKLSIFIDPGATGPKLIDAVFFRTRGADPPLPVTGRLSGEPAPLYLKMIDDDTPFLFVGVNVT